MTGSAQTSPRPAKRALHGSVLRGPRTRLRLLLVVAAGALLVDQTGKLVAATVHPAGFAQNPSLRGSVWPTLTLALAVCVVPFRPLVAAVGLSLGGGLGNLLDHYLWPGGTPDFISISWLLPDAVWNPADLLVVIGAVGIGLTLLVWPVHVAVRQWRQTSARLRASSA